MEKINHPFILKLNTNIDIKGNLVSIEELNNIPFEFKRLFYIFENKHNVVRGKHANRFSEFLFICLVGSCKVKYFYGSAHHEVLLDKPNIGLYLPNMIWKEMYEFSKDSILLVISNTFYDKDEYISDFDLYLKEYKEFYGKNKF
jgi:dTDP-4-dehydrorhamnose 3,5-epimerase-like enzyme